jgi:hypothetical protein
MAHIQYHRYVDWDATLFDLGTIGSSEMVIDGVKNTAGAPTATAGRFAPGCIINNISSGIVYVNSGTQASPVWKVISATATAAPFYTVLAGTASGGTTATRAYTVTGALATDVASAVIRASTNAVSIQKATLTANTLTVLFSADPGASTTVDYTITRAS